MTSSFYNRILNKIESYLTSSKAINSQSPDRFKKSLSFSPGLLSSVSTKTLSTTSRLKRLASSIENLQPNKSLIRSSSLSNNQIKTELLEERLFGEQAKNSNYLSEISSLKFQIADLNNQLHYHPDCLCKCNHNDCNRNIDNLIKENEVLRRFKENVFAISKKYDEINESVLLSLKEIDHLFTQMNDAKGGINDLKKMQTIESSIHTFEKVINTLVDMMKSKQDEYNYLIEIRENEINQLSYEGDKLKHHICSLENNLHILNHKEDHCHNCLKNNNLCICYHNHHYSSPEKKYISQRLNKNISCDSFS